MPTLIALSRTGNTWLLAQAHCNVQLIGYHGNRCREHDTQAADVCRWYVKFVHAHTVIHAAPTAPTALILGFTGFSMLQPPATPQVAPRVQP